MRRRYHVIPNDGRLAAIAAALAIAAADALAQEAARPQRRIVVSIAERKLALIEDGRVLRMYDTAVGAASSPSPVGEFTIELRLPHPTWYGPKQVVPPGKSNPLGTRWLGLSKKGYGIHGTNSPRSIGRAASHGCIRMRNADVEELFEMVAVGDRVELRSETLLAAGVPVEVASAQHAPSVE
jgi:lipoprotein-anchoring transpeptidase ErfK/SrfK